MTVAEIEGLTLAEGETITGYPPENTRLNLHDNTLLPITIRHNDSVAFSELSFTVGEGCMVGYHLPKRNKIDFDRGSYVAENLVELCGEGTRVILSIQ
jgi:hypothetical protein